MKIGVYPQWTAAVLLWIAARLSSMDSTAFRKIETVIYGYSGASVLSVGVSRPSGRNLKWSDVFSVLDCEPAYNTVSNRHIKSPGDRDP